MRLLQHDYSGNLSLVEFIGDKIPPYAILSHTWSQTSKEVTFAAFQSGDYMEKPEYAESYEKIRRCGEQAKKDGLGYFWVDTCCINKESSAELSEAINSMFAWYKDADVCYAYLNDVHHNSEFHNSRWFRRGWTLQELLAPADVVFFNASWSTIGFKTSLIRTLSRHTGINMKALYDGASFDGFCIAEKMSWAANRQTSRVEDQAYCLMGLFDVNMPLIYGEGRRAFVRLQEELLKRSNDTSIFAYFASWNFATQTLSGETLVSGNTGLFAASPVSFRQSAEYTFHPVLSEYLQSYERSPQATRIRKTGHITEFVGLLWEPEIFQRHDRVGSTERDLHAIIEEECGLRFTLPSIRDLRLCAEIETPWTIAFLDCRRRDGGIVGIILQQNTYRGTYTRVHYPSIVETESSSFKGARSLTVRTIDIEVDIPKSFNIRLPFELDIQVVYRTSNFHEHGLRQYHNGSSWTDQYSTEYRAEKAYNIPRIVFRRHHSGYIEEEGVMCTLIANKNMADAVARSEISAQDCVLVPTSRGATTRIALNKDFRLVMQSQMQWERHGAPSWIDRKRKQCLVCLSIEKRQDSTDESVLLDDGPFQSMPPSPM